MHESRYGHASPSDPIQLVNVRVTGTGKSNHPRPIAIPAAQDGESLVPTTMRQAFFETWMETPVFDRSALRQGDSIIGPAIFEESGSTIVVPPGQMVEPAANGSIVIFHRQPALVSSHSLRSL